MERLTNGIDYCKLHCDFGKSNECFFSDKDKCYERSIYNRLREYENLEEQGLLLRLPCKVGDTVYTIYSDKDTSFVEGPIVKDVSTHRIWIENRCFDYSDIGKTVFLTKAEAEQKLKEMEGDSDG